MIRRMRTSVPTWRSICSMRAARGPCSFTLLVPNRAHGLHKLMDPEDTEPAEAEAVLAAALPAMREAAGAEVGGMVGDPAPLTAIQDAVYSQGFDDRWHRTPDIGRAMRTLGFKPGTQLRDGLVRTLTYYRDLQRNGAHVSAPTTAAPPGPIAMLRAATVGGAA